MRFTEILSPFDDMRLFGAKHGEFTFVISHDAKDTFSATVKTKGAVPFDGSMNTLGYRSFKTLDEAVAACEKFINDQH